MIAMGLTKRGNAHYNRAEGVQWLWRPILTKLLSTTPMKCKIAS